MQQTVSTSTSTPNHYNFTQPPKQLVAGMLPLPWKCQGTTVTWQLPCPMRHASCREDACDAALTLPLLLLQRATAKAGVLLVQLHTLRW